MNLYQQGYGSCIATFYDTNVYKQLISKVECFRSSNKTFINRILYINYILYA